MSAMQLQEDSADIGCQEKQVLEIMEYCKSQNAKCKKGREVKTGSR